MQVCRADLLNSSIDILHLLMTNGKCHKILRNVSEVLQMAMSENLHALRKLLSCSSTLTSEGSTWEQIDLWAGEM